MRYFHWPRLFPHSIINATPDLNKAKENDIVRFDHIVFSEELVIVTHSHTKETHSNITFVSVSLSVIKSVIRA